MAIQVTMATLQASPTRHYHTDEISGQEYLPNTYLNLGGRVLPKFYCRRRIEWSSRQSNIIRRPSALQAPLARGGEGMGIPPPTGGGSGGPPPGNFQDLSLGKVHFGAFWEMIVP